MIIHLETVQQLELSIKTNVATPYFTQTASNYITNISSGGTATIRTNYLSVLISQNKQLDYPYKDISDFFKKHKITFYESLLNKTMPVRAFVELPIIINFVIKYEQIKFVIILEDNGQKENPNRNLIMILKRIWM